MLLWPSFVDYFDYKWAAENGSEGEGDKDGLVHFFIIWGKVKHLKKIRANVSTSRK